MTPRWVPETQVPTRGDAIFIDFHLPRIPRREPVLPVPYLMLNVPRQFSSRSLTQVAKRHTLRVQTPMGALHLALADNDASIHT